MADFPEAFPAEAVRQLCGEDVLAAARIGGGRNSRVFVAETGRTRFVVKEFFRCASDSRPRLSTEVAAYRGLRACGFTEVPEVLACNETAGLALYSVVDGDKIDADRITPVEVEAVADFILRLQDARVRGYFADFANASEACFCPAQTAENLQRRLARFDGLSCDGGGGLHEALVLFLRQQLAPFIERALADCAEEFSGCGLDWRAPLAQELRILTPSDFGFHNMLRDRDGGLHFLDFEYFGWDSPEKSVCDFLLHPAVDMSEELRGVFLRRICAGLAGDETLYRRVRGSFGLFGAKWCLILLNEFLAAERGRRSFAGEFDRQALGRQLDKARAMFEQLIARGFPY